MFPEPTELVSIGCSIESFWTQKIQIKCIDTKSQLADILTKGKFTRDEWNHLLCLFNISHFSSTDCSEVMSKRTQKDAGEERATAKSKPMMNLVSRCSVRDPNVFASTASESPEKTKSESQNVPLSSWNEQQPRTVRPVMGASSSNYSEKNIDDKWSSQEWKSGEMWGARTVRPVSEQPFTQHTDRFVIDDDDMDSNTATESDLSLKSRSFLHKLSDRVAKDVGSIFKRCNTRQQQRFFFFWWMFMTSTLEASEFMGKNYSENLHSLKNTGNNLTMKQMFDISEKLMVEQSDEIFGVSQISWEDSPWKQLSLVNDEEVISLSHAKVYVFPDSVFCLGKVNERWIRTQHQILFGKNSWVGSKIHHNTKFLDTIEGKPMEFEWNICPGFTTLQLVDEVQKFMKMSDPAQFQGRIIFMSMFNDILWWSEDNERECNADADFVFKTAKRFSPARWSFLGPGWEKKWFSTYIDRPRGEWDRVAELMMINSEKADTQFSVPGVHCPEERSKRRWTIIDTLLCRWWYDWNFFRTIVSVNQLSIYGAVSDVCEEYSACQTRTGRPVMVGQSDPLFEPAKFLITTPTPSTEVPAQEDLLQKYKERVERLSQQDRLMKICNDAGFLKTVERRTILHDKTYRRVLTICRASDMSWIHFTTRWKINWPERLDSREHQSWTRIGSHNQLPAM